jgi:hypothetical protein
MSGGHFDFNQHRIKDIADSIQSYLDKNEKDLESKTVLEFQIAIKNLKLAYIYAHRIDWFISCDDGEETFHERLKDDLRNVQRI